MSHVQNYPITKLRNHKESKKKYSCSSDTNFQFWGCLVHLFMLFYLGSEITIFFLLYLKLYFEKYIYIFFFSKGTFEVTVLKILDTITLFKIYVYYLTIS